MVDPDFRGKNVAIKLYEFMLGDLKEYEHLGSDPSPAAEKSMKRSGFYELSSTDKYILPVEIIGFLRTKFKKIPKAIHVHNYFAILIIKLFSSSKEKYFETTLNDLSDDYLRHIKPADSSWFQIQTIRSLKWRLQERPLHKLEAKIYSNKQDAAFIVYKAGIDLRLAPLNNSKLSYMKVLSICYSLAIEYKCSKIQLRVDRQHLPKIARLILYKSNHSTTVLRLGHHLDKFGKFSYSLLDSDENI